MGGSGVASDAQTPGLRCPSAAFILVGFAMRPEAVTETLQLQPSTCDVSLVHNCRTNRKEECGLWSYNTAEHVSSPDVAEHIEHLLTLFRPLKSRLEEIAPRPNTFVYIQCGSRSGLGSFITRIDARYVAGIAELGAALTFSVVNLPK